MLHSLYQSTIIITYSVSYHWTWSSQLFNNFYHWLQRNVFAPLPQWQVAAWCQQKPTCKTRAHRHATWLRTAPEPVPQQQNQPPATSVVIRIHAPFAQVRSTAASKQVAWITEPSAGTSSESEMVVSWHAAMNIVAQNVAPKCGLRKPRGEYEASTRRQKGNHANSKSGLPNRFKITLGKTPWQGKMSMPQANFKR